MSDDSLALTIPSDPSGESEFDAILATIASTERGRRFLDAYAQRCRGEDMQRLLAAVERIERMLAATAPSASAPDARQIAGAPDRAEAPAAAQEPTTLSDQRTAAQEQSERDVLPFALAAAAAPGMRVAPPEWIPRDGGEDARTADLAPGLARHDEDHAATALADADARPDAGFQRSDALLSLEQIEAREFARQYDSAIERLRRELEAREPEPDSVPEGPDALGRSASDFDYAAPPEGDAPDLDASEEGAPISPPDAASATDAQAPVGAGLGEAEASPAEGEWESDLFEPANALARPETTPPPDAAAARTTDDPPARLASVPPDDGLAERLEAMRAAIAALLDEVGTRSQRRHAATLPPSDPDETAPRR